MAGGSASWIFRVLIASTVRPARRRVKQRAQDFVYASPAGCSLSRETIELFVRSPVAGRAAMPF
jgi:hypothetical protein